MYPDYAPLPPRRPAFRRGRFLYSLLLLFTAFLSAVFGAVGGGWAVFQFLQAKPTLPPAPLSATAAPASPQQLTVSNTEVQSAITQAVEKVGPAVVTVVGTVPGQMTIFGRSAD